MKTVKLWLTGVILTITAVSSACAQVQCISPCCLLQFDKTTIQGSLNDNWGPTHKCGSHIDTNGIETVTIVLKTNLCDENNYLTPSGDLGIPDGSVLKASGCAQKREDGFEHFSGPFTITDPKGVEIFDGSITLIHKLGTHHAPWGTENCAQHIEGFLTGGSYPVPVISISSLIVADVKPTPLLNVYNLFATFDGDVFDCATSGIK